MEVPVGSWCIRTVLAVALVSAAVASRLAESDSPSEHPGVTPNAPATGSAHSSVTQAPLNCLAEWLLLAGAPLHKAVSIATSPRTKKAFLDEASIKRFDLFVLSLVLDFDTKLATDLKECVERPSACPPRNPGANIAVPCSAAGRCLFNRTVGYTQCVCRSGLAGQRCELDVDECASTSLNDCDDASVAICLNVHGSFACECRPGFTEHSRRCEDVNECLDASHDCHTHANCSNTNGSYTCFCQPGYLGDGMECEVDFCSTSTNRPLCQEIQQVKDYNKDLEKKVQQRDQQIEHVLADVKLISGIFTTYARHVSELTRNQRGMRVDLDATQAQLHKTQVELDATKRELSASTTNITTAMEMHQADFEALRSDNSEKCGLLSWKSYSQETDSTRYFHQWSVVFNKTRRNSVLRVLYTSAFGHFSHTSGHCFTVSIRINGTECADPAPIRSGVSAFSNTALRVHTVVPGAISGTCRISATGPLVLSTFGARHCSPSGSTASNGYYRQPGQHITASLHIEELCSN